MRKAKPSQTDYSTQLDDNPITDDNFTTRSLAFGRAHESWFVLRRVKTPDGKLPTDAQWNAWYNWRKDNGISTSYMEKADIYQVPCEWPEQFDGNAPVSNREFRFPLPRVASPWERENIIRGFDQLCRDLEMKGTPREKGRIHQNVDEVLADMALAGRRLPAPVVSDALLATMGITRSKPPIIQDRSEDEQHEEW